METDLGVASRTEGKARPEQSAAHSPGDSSHPFSIDPFRAIVFPNRIRELRKAAGMPRLLDMSARLPSISYIRMSKIERGEVIAKPEEILAISQVLGTSAEQLLIDVDDQAFDIAEWAADLQDWVAVDPDEDRFAVLLAAAVRTRREQDRALTIAAIERDYGIAPVILSRMENAFKPLARWNDQAVAALCRLFDVGNAAELRAKVLQMYEDGELARHLDQVAHPSIRINKTRSRVAALRAELQKQKGSWPPIEPGQAAAPLAAAPLAPLPQGTTSLQPGPRKVAVFGRPLVGGLIANEPVGDMVEVPSSAGPRAFGLRMCRATLGPGLPARSIIIVDPDKLPATGGLAVVREKDGLRVLMVTFARNGGMIGFSEQPDIEVSLDETDPADLMGVVAAIYE